MVDSLAGPKTPQNLVRKHVARIDSDADQLSRSIAKAILFLPYLTFTCETVTPIIAVITA
jgi:hypothetical protein